MDALKKLEEKLIHLVDLVKELKATNARLTEEKVQLEVRLALLEESSKNESEKMQDLQQKRMLAELMIDEMLESIGTLNAGTVDSKKQSVVQSNE